MWFLIVTAVQDDCLVYIRDTLCWFFRMTFGFQHADKADKASPTPAQDKARLF